ncbi:adenylate kinase [Thermococcus peptonophilus]|uniref:adenylate kinase n=1 Tax=Thermococcus peptonophilus TaxID=53952 RepID=UPI0006D1CF9D
MPFVVVITGIPGVGKSTITKLALKKTRAKFRLVNFGDLMFEEAVNMGGLVKHRDEMRKLDPLTQKELQLKVAQRIVEIARTEPVLLDTHATIRTPPAGYLLGFPREVIEILNPNFIVIIEAAPPSEILGRRLRDLKRDRDVETEEQIARHQDLNRAAAVAYAMHSNALIKIIENHEDKGLEEAVNELVKVLDLAVSEYA